MIQNTIVLQCATLSSSQEPLVLFGRDDECARCCHHRFQRVTITCRQQRSIHALEDQPSRSELASCTRPVGAEPTTTVRTASKIHKRAQDQ